MTDKLLALLSMACLAAFIAILVFFVGELDLAVVCILVLLMAAYDFFVHDWTKRRKRPEG